MPLFVFIRSRDQPPTLRPFSKYHRQFEPTSVLLVLFGDIITTMSDEEELVTKPFKFVTSKPIDSHQCVLSADELICIAGKFSAIFKETRHAHTLLSRFHSTNLSLTSRIRC